MDNKPLLRNIFLKIRVIVLIHLFFIFYIYEVRGQQSNSCSCSWAGGLNTAQFGAVDIDNDGIKDLVAFDRQGNRLLCFKNEGIAGQINYTYVPQYSSLFPQLYHWAKFVDYNNDGKTDIFTYSPGWAGIIVYKNITTDYLKFKRVVYPYLTSYQGGGYTNIFVTYADYPAICDIDNDGDLDILSFWGLGSFVEMHKNLSMEKYGTADSLDFEKTEYCWGHFAESDESNQLFLDTCINGNLQSEPRQERHTGSTFLMIDLNGDGVKDLLLGDVDYPGLYALMNDGTPENAHIASYDTLFPDYDTTVRIFSMPAAAYIDVNNDGIKDLLVSPFDPNPYVSQNRRSVWLYLNEGENDFPRFRLVTKSFLQEDMLDAGSGAYPLFVDWDNDGLTDILLGNYGFYVTSWYDEHYTLQTMYNAHLQFYKNTGTVNKPVYQLWDNNVGNLDFEFLLGIYPAVADLDGDGDKDLLVGNADGKLILLQNNGSSFSVTDRNFAGIDVGDYSTPQLFDLDKDGLPDLVIGEKAGNLNYYHNDGTASSPLFTFVTDSLGKINVTDQNVSYNGYSTPCFYREPSGETILVCGSEQGKLFCFTGIDNNLEGAFYEDEEKLETLLDTTGISPVRGMRTAAAIADVDNDGLPEMVAGNFSGGLEFFNNTPELLPYVKNSKNKATLKFKISPNPANQYLRISFTKELPRNSMLIISNLYGETEIRKQIEYGSQSIRINTQGLIPGIYLITIKSDRSVGTTKVIVQH